MKSVLLSSDSSNSFPTMLLSFVPDGCCQPQPQPSLNSLSTFSRILARSEDSTPTVHYALSACRKNGNSNHCPQRKGKGRENEERQWEKKIKDYM